jgi:protein arginine kinase activator
MKCTNCGKNNASYHYRYNINGKVTESHLCPECAAKLQPNKEFAAKSNEMFKDAFDGFFDNSFFGNSLFDDSFFGNSLFGSRMMSPFGFMPTMYMPSFAVVYPEQEESSDDGANDTQQASGVDAELSRQREINALREQMKSAAENENYEEAAKLRDKLHELEKSDNQ